MSITCLPVALPRHSSRASAKVEPCGWMMKSTWQGVPPKAAEGWPGWAGGGRRGVAGFGVGGGDRAAERHVEMRMGIDAAGEHVLPGGVDRPVCLHVERFPDQRDPLAPPQNSA